VDYGLKGKGKEERGLRFAPVEFPSVTDYVQKGKGKRERGKGDLRSADCGQKGKKKTASAC
jgi:hypothetical protein